jgi:hypothetical protein
MPAAALSAEAARSAVDVTRAEAADAMPRAAERARRRNFAGTEP